jgi:hypothetical protein
MQQFSVYYSDVCLQLNMFRAFSRQLSGAQWLQWQPLVLPSYRGDSRAVFVVGPAGQSDPTCFGHYCTTTLRGCPLYLVHLPLFRCLLRHLPLRYVAVCRLCVCVSGVPVCGCFNDGRVLTCICLSGRLLLKVAHRTVTLTSRASVTLTRMRAHYVVGGTVYISHCYIAASFVIVPRSCA